MPDPTPDPNPPNEPVQTPDSSAAPTGSPEPVAGTPEPQATPSIENYRFTQEDITKQNLPTWAVNRTPAEVAQLGNTFYQQALTGQPQQQQPAQPQPSQNWNQQPQQMQQPLPQQVNQPTQDEWIQDPAAAAQQQQKWFNETQIAPQMNSLYQNNATVARQMIATEEKDAFDRWGPEIDSLIMRTDAQMRTPDNIRMIVNMVRGQHPEYITERAHAEAERIIAERASMGGVSTPGGMGTSAPGQNVLNLDVGDLPDNYRNLLQSEGLIREGTLTPAFYEFISKIKRPGQSDSEAAKAWFDGAKDQNIIISASGRGLRVEERS